MPDASGSYLISLFKKKTPEKPVIAMTGWEGDPAEELETNSTADTVLKKPFELEQLDQAIEKFLS